MKNLKKWLLASNSPSLSDKETLGSPAPSAFAPSWQASCLPWQASPAVQAARQARENAWTRAGGWPASLRRTEALWVAQDAQRAK